MATARKLTPEEAARVAALLRPYLPILAAAQKKAA